MADLFDDDVERPVLALQVSLKSMQRNVGVAVREARSRSSKEDTKAWTFTVYSFLDNEQLSLLDALLIQVGAGRCYFAGTKESTDSDTRKVLGLLERHNVRHHGIGAGVFRPNSQDLEQDLRGLLGEANLSHYGSELEKPLAMGCVNALMKGMDLVAGGLATHTLQSGDISGHVKLDGAAMAAMNLLPDPQFPVQNGSVYDVLNRCKTGMGSRLLERWLRAPLLDRAAIEQRQEIVQTFRDDAFLRDQLQETGLKKIPDLEKLQGKLTRGRATLGDLVALYRFSDALTELLQIIQHADNAMLNTAFANPLQQRSTELEGLRELISEVVDLERLPELFISARHSEELSGVQTELDQCMREIEALHREANSSWGRGMDIKLDKDKQHGWIFRITKKKEEKNLRKNNPKVVTLSVLNNGVHFTTRDELQDLGLQHKDLVARYEVLQQELVKQAVVVAASYVQVLEAATQTISQLDVLVALAHVAALAPSEYVRPTLTDMGTGNIELVAARHPCVEMQDGMSFIPNNYTLDREQSRFQIITGPNMGGKSTYIRQLGAIVIMAQIGSFVPCTQATVSVVDSVLARVGAGDCQQRGISTFMAEMLEASSILQTATASSLVIIDELGRGTSTYDGFGLAWAISESLLNTTRCFTLFATHFHELTELEESATGVVNKHVTAHTTDNSITMLYEVKPGPCLRSFGIHVAELAQFPASVIAAAKRKAEELETFNGAPAAEGQEDGAGQPAKRVKHSSPTSVEELEAQRAVRSFLGAFAATPVDQMADEECLSAVRQLADQMMSGAAQNPKVKQVLEQRFEETLTAMEQ